VSRQFRAVAILAVAALVAAGCGADQHRTASRPPSGGGGGGGVAAPQTPGPTAGTQSTPGKPPRTKPANPPPTTPDEGSPSSPPHPPGGGTGPAGSTRVTGSNAVALTFDDGPDPVYTPQILDLLKEHGVKATFCLVGFRAATQPDLVRRIVAEGHTLCNHTWQHLFDIGRRAPDYIRQDLEHTSQVIHEAVPDAPIKYFRAPGGNFTAPLVQIAREMGMTSIYWAVDTRDWEFTKWGRGPSMVQHIISVVEHTTGPGSIVLSHDLAKPDTIAAYRELLPWLKARFTLIPLPT
jgi:peptidoglycan/xylan/chitin deacetylase (PgdA/CDA1 family)